MTLSTFARVRPLVAMLAATAAAIGVLAVAPPAHADDTYIYWTTNNGSSAGRASIDGTGVNTSFFTTGGTSWGIALNSTHIFWSVDVSVASGVWIGRVNIDGTGANQNYLTTSRPPYGLAINSTHIYWANHSRHSIGRANLDGTGAVMDFISGLDEPEDVAVDANYVYWTDLGHGTGTIGRANLDGTGKQTSFIASGGNPQGVAVTATHIYWTNGLGWIGRANLNGSAPNGSFIHSFGGPAGIAVNGSHLYWADVTGKRIVTSNLDGTGAAVLIDLSASPGGTQPWGVAIATIPSGGGGGGGGGGSGGTTPAADPIPEVLPPDVMQSIGISSEDTCGGVGDPTMNWAGVASGGWTKSWAQWPNDGAGGWVCNRMLGYGASSHAWSLRTGSS